MRIAVCDDEKRYREKIVNLIQEYEKIRQNYSFTDVYKRQTGCCLHSSRLLSHNTYINA